MSGEREAEAGGKVEGVNRDGEEKTDMSGERKAEVGGKVGGRRRDKQGFRGKRGKDKHEWREGGCGKR